MCELWSLVVRCKVNISYQDHYSLFFSVTIGLLPEGVPGGRIGTRFHRSRGTSPLKGVNPAGTPGYRNGTKSFFGLKGPPSVVWGV